MEKTVILNPGKVSAKDGDIHHIGVRQLTDLYKVRPTDKVIVYDPKNPLHSPARLQEMYPDALHLFPRVNGDYYDIHEKETPPSEEQS